MVQSLTKALGGERLLTGEFSPNSLQPPIVNHASLRGAFLVTAGVSAVTCALDTAVCVIAHVGNILTGGMTRYNGVACDFSYGVSHLVARPFAHLIQTINPEAKFRVDSKYNVLARDTVNNMTSFANGLTLSNNLFVKHVGSRATYLFMTVAIVIVRLVSLIIGVLAALASLLTLGSSKWEFNHWAYNNLSSTVMIAEVLHSLTLAVNPWATISSRSRIQGGVIHQ